MLYLSLAIFCLGIFLRFFTISIFQLVILILCCVGVWSVFYFLTKQKVYLCAVLLGTVFIFGIVRADYSAISKSQFENLSKNYVFLEGVVSAEPKMSDKGMKMQVEVLKVGSSALIHPEKTLIGYEGYETFSYGDKVKIGGALELPEAFGTDGGRSFDYPNYLKKDGIFFVIQKAKVEKVGEGGGNFLISILFEFKRAFIGKIGEVISSGDTALMSGILLGSQDTISQKVKDDFRNSGLMHIMVLSGYNITVVGEAVSRTANIWLSKFVSLGFGGFAIILFALLSGGGASTVRSTIMALIAILGRILGREYDALRALFLVGFLMIVWNPYTLLYDPSFHLSFLATLGMILLSKRIEVKMMWIRFAILREIVATTLAVQIFVTPYFLWSMGSVSIISLVSNVFVLPMIPLTMFFGFITGLLGFISSWFYFVPGFISHILLLYIQKLLPFSPRCHSLCGKYDKYNFQFGV